MPSVDRPDARLVTLRRRAEMRLETVDRRVLADVPERVGALTGV